MGSPEDELILWHARQTPLHYELECDRVAFTAVTERREEVGVNWITEEAKRADPSGDRVILENPRAVEALDELLLTKYLPLIREELEKTVYNYAPRDTPNIESTWNGPQLARKLTYMLFDPTDFPFLRLSVSCHRSGYMIEKEFTLNLAEATEPGFVFRILGDPHFAGNPPSLHIERSVLHPEWGTLMVEIHAGSGFDSGPWGLHSEGLADIARTIKDACEMYELSMIEPFESLEEVDRFLEVAHRSFEAS